MLMLTKEGWKNLSCRFDNPDCNTLPVIKSDGNKTHSDWYRQHRDKIEEQKSIGLGKMRRNQHESLTLV
jgi:hypothetical protein